MILIKKISLFAAFLLVTISASAQKTKIDGVVGVVGDYVILDSDIDKTYLELKQQGVETKEISRCQMFGKLLEDKLYAHQAIQDSIVVTDTEVNQKLDEQLNYMVEQLGSMEKVVQYFKKSSVEDFKTELFDIIKMNKLTSEMQKKIVDEVKITPEEVRDFFKAIPKDDLPVFGAEMEVAQIVIKPEVSKEAKQAVIDQLKAFKKDIQENGASFFTKAVLYSEDPGSKNNGGYYKMNRKTQFVKEFKDVAFSLQEGEISEPFETEFGYHIIQVDKIKGQDVELRHIVIAPKVPEAALKAAKEKAESIRTKILNKEITFAEAARTMSEEKETKNDGGVLTNPKTQDTRFELTKMDPAMYSVVANLKDGEVSYAVSEDDRTGRKFYKIMTVTNRFNEHTADYSKDYIRLKELALKEKQLKAIAKWSEEKIKETHIKINGEYRDCTYTNNWLKK
ncbi:peptidylprolyl isomerase [Flavobacterium amnicola]|uniref:Peptidylprolyl isomerase n=1 Tax=Flavobacterium amnicola TaxID=2506422 RepID=A0A4Q1K5J5_9FLAO|nr:peptidylprolyl isomerase [Flavobacterium amnicola]RXR20434.1 peptidylprolyl isomerase [Flavobacterium amnicola]